MLLYTNRHVKFPVCLAYVGNKCFLILMCVLQIDEEVAKLLALKAQIGGDNVKHQFVLKTAKVRPQLRWCPQVTEHCWERSPKGFSSPSQRAVTRQHIQSEVHAETDFLFWTMHKSFIYQHIQTIIPSEKVLVHAEGMSCLLFLCHC